MSLGEQREMAKTTIRNHVQNMTKSDFKCMMFLSLFTSVSLSLWAYICGKTHVSFLGQSNEMKS